jgi:branched-chain amino acid transport system substrate-binding protein
VKIVRATYFRTGNKLNHVAKGGTKMKTKMSLGLMILALIISMAMVVGEAETADILKIGVVQPLSGSGAAWGVPVDRGVRLAAEDINRAGGIRAGGKTYQVEVISEDDEFTPNVGIAAFNKMIHQHGVKYIIGPMGSGIEKVVSPITEPNKVIMMFCGASRPRPTDFYTVRAIQISDQYAPACWAAFKKLYPNAKTVVQFEPDTETGNLAAKVAPIYAKAADMKMLDLITVPEGTKDFYPILTKAIALKPDGFVGGATQPGDFALIMKQARELGYQGVFVADYGSDTAMLLKVAGPKAAEGIIQSGTADYIGFAFTPEMREVGERYLKKYGTQDAWSLEYYNDMLFIKQGIEAANSIDTTKVIETWRSPGFTMTGLYGKVRWVGKELYGINSILTTPLPINQIKNGKEVVVTTVTWEEMVPFMRAILDAEKK